MSIDIADLRNLPVAEKLRIVTAVLVLLALVLVIGWGVRAAEVQERDVPSRVQAAVDAVDLSAPMLEIPGYLSPAEVAEFDVLLKQRRGDWQHPLRRGLSAEEQQEYKAYLRDGVPNEGHHNRRFEYLADNATNEQKLAANTQWLGTRLNLSAEQAEDPVWSAIAGAFAQDDPLGERQLPSPPPADVDIFCVGYDCSGRKLRVNDDGTCTATIVVNVRLQSSGGMSYCSFNGTRNIQTWRWDRESLTFLDSQFEPDPSGFRGTIN